MLHRHLTHQQFILAANIIAHGRRSDWAELRVALHKDHTLTAKIERIWVKAACIHVSLVLFDNLP
jgi:hypothetical protein